MDNAEKKFRRGDKARHVLTGEIVIVLRFDNSGYRVRSKTGEFHASDVELVGVRR